MNPIIRNLAIFTAILIIVMTPYYILRSGNIEKKYSEGIIAKTELIRPAAEMLNREQTPDPEKIKRLFDEIISKEPSTAALVLTDRYDNLKYLIKNDSVIRSGVIVDGIISDIKGKKFITDAITVPVEKTYNDGRGGNEKFYLSPYSNNGQRAFAIFAFKLEKKLKVRLVFEVLLLISFSFTFTGITLTFLKKKGITEDVYYKTIVLGAKKASAENKDAGNIRESRDSKKSATADQINENELTPIIGSGTSRTRNETSRRNNPETESASDALNTRVFDLFKQIHRELKPESIALYIKKMEGRLSKTWELKEKTFLRIDSSLFENIKISEIENVKNSGAHVVDDGRAVRIPLIDDESLVGLIEIRLKESGGNPDLVKLQAGVRDISREVKDFLVINNVIVDRETGFFSSSYFSMKLSEQIYSAQKIGTAFYLLLIDVFRDLDLDREHRNTVLKIIHPVIKKSSGETHEMFLHDGKVGMIITGTGANDVENIELAVSKDISKFRIKLSADNIIRLKPAAAIMGSSEASNVKDILKETLELFNTEG